MAKPSKKRASLMGNYRRVGTLAVVGVVALGGAYAASAGDLLYASRSLLAAVIAPIDTTPRLVISRNASTPIWSVWPGAEKTFAVFDVAPRYLQYYGYLRTFTGSVHVNSSSAGLSVGKIGVRYEACETNGYCVAAQVPISSPVASSSIMGKAYFFNASLAPNLVGPNKTGKVIITGIPYYDTVYATASTTASVKAQIDYAAGAGQVVSTASTTSTVYRSVPVYTNLAYGNWIKVSRGSGYAYGYWDINNSGALAASDANIIANVAVGTQKCPLFKLCDVNKSGSVTVTDSSLLLKYAVGSLPPPTPTVMKPSAPTVSFVSATTQVESIDGSRNDRATFVVKYKILAEGSDFYIPSGVGMTTLTSPALNGKTNAYLEKQGIRVGGGTPTIDFSGVTQTSTGNYVIKKDTTANVTLTIRADLTQLGSTAGMYRAGLLGFSHGLADVVPLLPYTLVNSDSFKTNYVNLD
jgi:hypothetical protein